MKLIHLSDLHLGKRVNEYPMSEDQKYILLKILNIIDEEKPDGVLIAGDVYDRNVPSEEAVQLFDDFLVRLSGRKIPVFIISGNHDSAERVAFGGRLMSLAGVHISPVYDGKVEPITLTDAYGPVHFYLLPFVKPAHIRAKFPDKNVDSYTAAVREAIGAMEISTEERNVILTHQFVTGARRSDSEEIPVGGLDNVDASVFSAFDYVALGHIHSPQTCGSDTVRYCGTPLKYSFSEAKDQKSVTVVELAEKGNVAVRTVDLVPLHDMVELRGTYEELTRKSFYENTTWQEDYTQIVLTDEVEIPDAMRKLQVIYHRLMHLKYDNTRTRTVLTLTGTADVENKTPLALFAEFYLQQTGREMCEEQTAFVEEMLEEIMEEQE